MNSYTVGRILVGLAGAAVAAILVFSLAPIAFGGLDVTMDEDLSVEYDDMTQTLTIEGNINIASAMPWDIELSYEVVLGTEDNPIWSSSKSTTIPSGQTGSLPIDFEIGVDDLMLYFLTCLESEFKSDSTDGTFEGKFSLPLTIKLNGSYIQSLVGFDVGVGFDLGGSAKGKLECDEAGTKLKSEIKIELPEGLAFEYECTFAFKITDKDGNSVNGTLSYDGSSGTEGVISLDVSTDPSSVTIAGILDSYLNGGGTIELNGKTIVLTPEQMKTLADAIKGLLDHAGVTL
ncbi:MAG: hypothetical protein LBE48_04365 [Methanomassiliicoccaceae archaeon]|jgi:hypothetical protein|nr:hypothetical protein [Methanomassiliicoccaceae archaeon]